MSETPKKEFVNDLLRTVRSLSLVLSMLASSADLAETRTLSSVESSSGLNGKNGTLTLSRFRLCRNTTKSS